MIYRARPPGLPLVVLIPCFILQANLSSHFIMWATPAFFILLSLGLSYQVKISDTVKYEMTLFFFCIYRKIAKPDDIRVIVFKDAGWGTPSGFVKMNKGFTLRIVHFHPLAVLEELKNFANRNNITIKESKHYKAIYELRKRKEHRETFPHNGQHY